MPTKSRQSQIARLKHEVERLADEHAKVMQQHAPTESGRVRKLAVTRAEVLARRIRQLNEMLDALEPERSD